MPAPAADRLAPLETRVVDHVFDARPNYAASIGRHEFDGRLPDLSIEFTTRWSARTRQLLGDLRAVPDVELTEPRRLDRQLLELLLEGALFDLEGVRELDRNPMSYLFQPDLTGYISRDYAPVAERVRAVAATLSGVPALLATARRRLEPVLARPFVTLGIQIGSGLPSHFAEGEAFAATGPAELRGDVRAAREAADSAVGEFVEWLKRERLPSADESFPLGLERFQRLLWVREGLTTPVDEVLRQGWADLRRNRARLDAIAAREGTTPSQLIARLNDDHPKPAEIMPLVRNLTNDIREFVRRTDLASIPEPEVCHVRETPPWARDLWTAALSPPGPFEKPVDGIYWVTTVDASWTPEQQEGWARTLNYAMLKNTTVHEVWPGHYLQALHFRRTEQSLARKVWFSYSFTEGWAHYCEQLALEAGFDGGSMAAEVTELADALTRNVRLVASIGLHTQGMRVEEATRLFQTEAFLEEFHAQREAIRGTYNPEYFCYTLGKLAILEVRAKYLGPKFGRSLRAFHDTLLGYGMPPIGLLDRLLAQASPPRGAGPS
ncbi:MAG TPA: DUF885 domain-containing protein [Thermoplasmata archaeon]|nr:DUF885 domain-containing protein [Thermoplasmata archaeon]